LALIWAGRQSLDRPLHKLVLLAIADHADKQTAECYPSVAALCEWTGCDRKTIIAATAALEAARLLIDTGSRRGKTGQVKVYRLAIETVPETASLTETVPKTAPLKSTVFPTKQSQKRDTEPPKEPSPTESSTPTERRERNPKSFVPPDWVPMEPWNGWIEMRRSIGKRPTLRALQLAVENLQHLADAGHPPGKVLDQSTLKNWTGLFEIKGNRDDQRSSNSRLPAAEDARHPGGPNSTAWRRLESRLG
jgi:hypothetical protein